MADIAVDEFERIYRSAGARLAFLTAARNVYLEKPFGSGGFYPRLAQLEPPAMFVWSSHDKLIPPGFQRHVERWLPSAEQILLDGCGHVPQVERPERTNGLLERFFARIDALGRARRLEARVTADHDQRPRLAPTPRAAGSRPGADDDAAGEGGGLLGSVLGAVKGFVAGRIPPADLDERDPDYIRESLPRLWLLSSLYFRGEVRGLGNVPEEGGVLLVGNHSGGNLTPDTIVFTLAFSTYFGVERAFHQLAHNLVLSFPGLSYLRKYGTVAASHENARTALEAGAAVLVYPGGDYEVHRPSWHRHRVDFGGRKGFIRLALDQDVPIVPVVAVGGQETALFLSRGESLAQVLGLDRLLRLKVLPISLALPWGLNVGDMLGHIPLPAKITVEALPPIHLREEFGPEPDVDEVYDHVRAADAGHARRARRRAAAAGAGLMRVAESIDRSTRRPSSSGTHVSDPSRYLHFMSGVTRWSVEGEQATGPRRPLPDAAARRLGRGRRPDRDRRVQAGAATSPGTP